MREPDAIFADPRQAVLYDVFEDDRSDLDLYVAIAQELAAGFRGRHRMRDRIAGRTAGGIGTARRRRRPGDCVARCGSRKATTPSGSIGSLGTRPLWSAWRLSADLAVMTGNVAQVFVADDDWHLTLDAVSSCLRPGGWLVFETRRPEVRDWESWGTPPTTVTIPGAANAVTSMTVTRGCAASGHLRVGDGRRWRGPALDVDAALPRARRDRARSRCARLRCRRRSRRPRSPRQGVRLRLASRGVLTRTFGPAEGDPNGSLATR